ncbi:MAG TPA: hypothetical protein VFY58_09540, partial [Nocardioides sp.]|nr:hypothetical protein [Nocardioides sp.]
MTAPPPDDPDDRQPPGPDGELDFDAEFERLVANWTPSDPSAEVDPAETSSPDGASSTAEPPSSVVEPLEPPPSVVEPPPSVVEPVETPDERLRNLFRPVWPEPETAA